MKYKLEWCNSNVLLPGFKSGIEYHFSYVDADERRKELENQGFHVTQTTIYESPGVSRNGRFWSDDSEFI